MSNVKTLIHVHTDYSFDSDISLSVLGHFLDEQGFGCIAVTDHDTIEGARRLQEHTNARVIVGEEVTTGQGHLIGLFLSEHVRPGLSALETAREIRAQGGLVLLPHPFVRAMGCGLGDVSWEIAEWIDAVEVNNAQNLRGAPDRAAGRFAADLDLPAYAGADSHAITSIAPCYQVLADFTGPSGFLESLRDAELTVGYHRPAYFAGLACRVARHLLGLGLPAGFGANTSPSTSPRRRPSRAAA
ncbi:MAG: hypothetical protein GY842_10860 [bacterium]|nr:hypothetical protein [bacterium]